MSLEYSSRLQPAVCRDLQIHALIHGDLEESSYGAPNPYADTINKLWGSSRRQWLPKFSLPRPMLFCSWSNKWKQQLTDRYRSSPDMTMLVFRQVHSSDILR